MFPKTRSSLRFKSAVANVALLATASVISVLVAELAVHVVLPQQLIIDRPDIWQPADTLGWTHRPSVKTTINTGERTVHVYTDREGFRVGRKGRTEAGRTVLVLGDSFMEAFQVEYEQSLPGLLEEGLSDVLGTPIAVRSAGVDGWGLPQYLASTRLALARDPALALVLVSLYVGNDIMSERIDYLPPKKPAERHRLRLPRSPERSELIDAILYPINDLLEVRSHLYILLKTQVRRTLQRLGLTAHYIPTEYLYSQANSNSWRITAEQAAEIHGIAATKGVPTLYVLIPARFQVDTIALLNDLEDFGIPRQQIDIDQPNRLVKQAMEELDLTVIDATPWLRGAGEDAGELFGSVDQHLSPAGHATIARELIPIVTRYLRARDNPDGAHISRH